MERLSKVAEDSKAWFQCLKKSKNQGFIQSSCEYRLGRNPCDEGLHHAYLKYLKETDTEVSNPCFTVAVTTITKYEQKSLFSDGIKSIFTIL